MIISHHWKFIFVKTRKTGGTSAEIALSRLCRPGDIVTPVSEEDEHLRPNVTVGPKQMTFDVNGSVIKLTNHSPLRDALRIFGAKLKDYKIISVERNPFDRAASMYFWKIRNRSEENSGMTVKWVINNFNSNMPLYSLFGIPVFDYMLRTESLDEDLAALAENLGIKGALTSGLVRAKSGYRPKSASREEIFADDLLRRVVESKSMAELYQFGYSFDRFGCEPIVPLLHRKKVISAYIKKLKQAEALDV